MKLLNAILLALACAFTPSVHAEFVSSPVPAETRKAPPKATQPDEADLQTRALP
jgi:hypothetical protein